MQLKLSRIMEHLRYYIVLGRETCNAHDMYREMERVARLCRQGTPKP